MHDIAKSFILIGSVFILVGIILALSGKFPGLGRLPGDIFIKRDNFTFYFPLATSLIVSVLLSLLFYLWNRH